MLCIDIIYIRAALGGGVFCLLGAKKTLPPLDFLCPTPPIELTRILYSSSSNNIYKYIYITISSLGVKASKYESLGFCAGCMCRGHLPLFEYV